MNYPHIKEEKETVDTFVTGGQRVVNAALALIISIIATGVVVLLAILFA